MRALFAVGSVDPPSGLSGEVRSVHNGSNITPHRLAADASTPRLLLWCFSLCIACGYRVRRREIQASSFVEFGPMVPILVGHCNSKDRFNRLTAVQWVHEFIKLGVRTPCEWNASSSLGMRCTTAVVAIAVVGSLFAVLERCADVPHPWCHGVRVQYDRCSSVLLLKTLLQQSA